MIRMLIIAIVFLVLIACVEPRSAVGKPDCTRCHGPTCTPAHCYACHD